MVMTIKQNIKLQNKINFIYSIVPLINYLKDKYNHNYIDDLILREIIEIEGYFYKIDLIRNTVYFIRWKSNLGMRKNEVIQECGIFNRIYNDMYKELIFPLINKNSYYTELGFLTFYNYRHYILKPNHCIYCDKYFSNLKGHSSGKKHIIKKKNIIEGYLGNKLNKDCINVISEFL